MPQKTQRSTKYSSTSATKKRSPRRLSPTNRPLEMSLHAWQRGLRIQAGSEAAFRLRNRDEHAFFGDFSVDNPDKGTSYRVSIRSHDGDDNFCTCPDFATNTLGICKHIAFALHVLSKRRGYKTARARGWTPAFSELFLHYGGIPEVRFRPGTDCPPRLLSRCRLKCDEQGRVLTPQQIPALLKAADRAGHELRFYDDARAFLARQHDDERRCQSLARAFPKHERDPALATLLPGARLLPYQCQGAWFIAQTGRCLLADDMGLGKTIQAIAAARLLRDHAQVERILIVCPASLKQQWADELLRFAKDTALIISGSRLQRRQQWASSQPPIKIVNYECLDSDLPFIQDWQPDLLLLDEAQRIKNWATLAAQAIRRLDAPHVAILTGTPLENRIEELHALVEVVDRHLLGPLFSFRDRHAVYEDDSTKIIGYRALDQIAQTLRPILLRRTKEEVLSQLPTRSVTTLHVPMTEEQKACHDDDAQSVSRLVHKWHRYKYLSEQDQLRLRLLLQRMRMVCDSTYLLDPSCDDNHKIAETRSLLERELADPTRKVVIFSTWLAMHELITATLDDAGWGYAFLNGGIPSPQRGALIARFHDDPQCRVFCSTDAGSTGLNLQCADVVINVDLPWNPAVLEQRIGRVHRMGQERPVRVYNLVSAHGIEGSIERLLSFKRNLFSGVLDGGASEIALKGNRLKKFLEDVERLDADLHEDAPAAAADAAQQAEERGDGNAAPIIGDHDPSSADHDTPKLSPTPTSPTQATSNPQLASMQQAFQAGANLLNELANFTAAINDPRYHDTDPTTGTARLVLPMDNSGPLAALQNAIARMGGGGG